MNELSTCPHFSICSGCSIEKDFFNPPIKKRIEGFFFDLNAPLRFHAKGFLSSRWKAKLATRGSYLDPQIGLFQKGSHNVVSIPHCLVHHPKINQAVAVLKQKMKEHKILPYDEKTNSGILRYAQFFVERSTEKVQLVLVAFGKESTSHFQDFCSDLQKTFSWHSIWVNLNPETTNRIFGQHWDLVFGEPWLWQKFGKASVAFHPGSFSQAHLPLFEEAQQHIASWISNNETVLELFAGTGAISLFIEDKCKEIELIENNPLSALSFSESLKKVSNPKKFSYFSENAEGPWKKYDTIIVDPPRKGLGTSVLHSLNQNQSNQLIYMSCDFQSFEKDCKILKAGGWKLKKGEAFSFFPGTNEIEVLALFQR